MANDTGEILIQVTIEDIKNGVRAITRECPVARAMSRALDREIRTDSRVWVVGDEPWFSGRYLPHEVTRRIEQFDCGMGMRPFSFKVRL